MTSPPIVLSGRPTRAQTLSKLYTGYCNSSRLTCISWHYLHRTNPPLQVWCCGPGWQKISIDCYSSVGRMRAVITVHYNVNTYLFSPGIGIHKLTLQKVRSYTASYCTNVYLALFPRYTCITTFSGHCLLL